MTALGNILAGGRIVASAVQSVAPDAVVKGADQPVTSSTALQNDDALYVPLAANTQWIFIAMVEYTGDATGSGGILFTFTTPSGSTLTWSQLYMGSSVSTPSMSGTGSGSGQTRSAETNGSAQVPMWIMGSVTVGATAGNLQFEWAQNASDTTATVVKAGSFVAAWQVG